MPSTDLSDEHQHDADLGTCGFGPLPHSQGLRDQAEAAFDVLEPLDDEPDEPDDPDEPEDPEELDDPDEEEDPELSEDEVLDELDEPDEDSDLPGFTVLVVDVLRESVR